MPDLVELPEFGTNGVGGTIRSYGYRATPLDGVSNFLVPGGSSLDASIQRQWIQVGNQPTGLRGLGCSCGMSGIPGMGESPSGALTYQGDGIATDSSGRQWFVSQPAGGDTWDPGDSVPASSAVDLVSSAQASVFSPPSLSTTRPAAVPSPSASDSFLSFLFGTPGATPPPKQVQAQAGPSTGEILGWIAIALGVGGGAVAIGKAL